LAERRYERNRSTGSLCGIGNAGGCYIHGLSCSDC
jgi:hypothetical protein